MTPMKSAGVQAGLLGVFIVVIISVVARLTVLDGSLFDPAVAPGIGRLALGDMLTIAAFTGGYLWARFIKSS